jgi:trimeric autotransporter adhesin
VKLKQLFLLSIILWSINPLFSQGTPISVGGQVATFTSMIRGYHFTAPTTFTICGLFVPPDANAAGTQTIRVVRFTAGPPPAFAGTTNSFVQLFTITNAPATGVIPCNIPVASGDIIGVYGARGANCVNSYGPANFVTSINGFNTTLQRSGMQSCPAGTGAAMANIWSEVNFNIGRIQMYINCCQTPTITAGSNSPICAGQPLNLTTTANPAGAYTYAWTGPNGFASTIQNPTIASPTIAAAGNYTVVVTIPNCGTANGTTAVVVNPGPTITVPPITICQGGSGTLTASSSTAGGTWTWSLGGNILGSGSTLSVNPTTNTTYTVEYSVNGCSSTSTVLVNVEPTPQPQIVNDSICLGQTGTLFVSNVSAGGSYAWSTGASTASLSASPIVNTTYSVVFTSANGCVSPSVSAGIIVKPNPIVSVANDTICIGSSTTINSSVDLPGGTYTWSPLASTSNSITVSPNSTSTYTVIYTLQGCTDAASSTVLVNPIPVASTSNTTICFGDVATLNASANLPNGTYLWSTTETTSSIQVSPATTTTYSVAYTLNNCTSPSVNAIVTVNPIPVVTLSSATICDGDNVTLTATPNLTGGSYTWGPLNNPGGASQTLSPSVDTTLTVIYTLLNCPSLAASGTVSVNPLPIVTFTSNIVEGCAPLGVTFTATDQSNAIYNWSTSNALTGSGVSTTLVFPTGGTYDVTLAATTINGCFASNSVANFIYVEDLPIADFESPISIFTNEAQYVQFSNFSTGATNYLWNFGDGQMSTEVEPSHIFQSTMNGYTINLIATTDLNCLDSMSISIGYQYNELYYIPNSFTPDGDQNNQIFLPIFYSGYDPLNFEMSIYNRWGEVVFETRNVQFGWDGSVGLEGLDAQEGTYTYRIIFKNPDLDERVVVTGTVNLIR